MLGFKGNKMKCFNHESKDAVGLCKHCSKGLCIDCCTDLGHGIACKGIHEKEVEQINSLIENNKRVYESQPKGSLIMPFFYLLMGVAFIFYGMKRGFDSLTFILGCGFAACGIIMFVYNTKFFKKITTKYST